MDETRRDDRSPLRTEAKRLGELRFPCGIVDVLGVPFTYLNIITVLFSTNGVARICRPCLRTCEVSSAPKLWLAPVGRSHVVCRRNETRTQNRARKTLVEWRSVRERDARAFAVQILFTRPSRQDELSIESPTDCAQKRTNNATRLFIKARATAMCLIRRCHKTIKNSAD